MDCETEPVKLVETSGGLIYPCGLLGLDGRRDWLIQTLRAGRGPAADDPEPVRAGGAGGVEDFLAVSADFPAGAVVNGLRGVEADSGMAVLVVVIAEEQDAERADLVD